MVTKIASLIAAVLVISNVPTTEQSRILAVFPHNGKSHYFMFEPLVFELAKRGHQVTVVTHFPSPTPPPNVTFVSIAQPGAQTLLNVVSLNDVGKSGWAKVSWLWTTLQSFIANTCGSLSHSNVQKLLNSDEKFDLLLMEYFVADCWASLAHHFNVPLAAVFSSPILSWQNERFGNPDNPAYIPNTFHGFGSRMSFMERVMNTILTYGYKIGYRLVFDPISDAYVAKYVGPNIPPVHEIVKRSSLFLVNSHFSLFQPRPLVPGIIEIGGLHVSSPKGKLPTEVLKFIEDSPNGVVFFSFGSMVKGSTMPIDKLKIMQEAFSKIRQRVLWKWEEDEMPGKPENVMLGKWFPQNDIFAHPNVRLFVTHSGLMGTTEAVTQGIPMLMLPLFGDQPVNAALCGEKEISIVIDYDTLTKESFSNALNEVLNNEKYMKNAKRLAKIFKDRPTSVMDTAIYWLEYVLRYDGAPHMQSAAVHLAWYQEYLLDVFGFLIFLTLSSIYLIHRVFRKCYSKSKNIKQKVS